MTNIKYLKENNLLSAHEHFMKLSEAYVPNFPEEEVDEADGQGAQDPNAMGGDPSQDPNAMGGDPSAMGMGDDLGADPNAIGGDESVSQDNGDTIDIDGLTKAQDKLNVKQNHVGMDLSKVDTKIKTLIDTIQNLQDKLDANNSEIESLKSEFEKRNPTQTEKLNLRSLDSYPFNVKPNEYWEKKARQGGYDTYSDNDEPTSKEYVITNNDVDNPTRDVADTFFKIDDDDIQTMDKLFKL